MERKFRLMFIGTGICLWLPLIFSEVEARIITSKSSLTIDEGGKGSYTVQLDAKPSAEITLDITTSNSDLRVKPEALTFTPDDWDQARKITIEAIVDADAEDDRATVSHSVRTPSDRRGATANPIAVTAPTTSSLKVTVRDKSVPSHEINISPSSGLSIRKGASGSYSVSLTEEPTASVTVSASSSRSDVRVSPSSRTFYVGTWNSSQRFTVSVDAGATSSGATISHSATSEDFNYQGLTIDSLPVTVLQPPAGITQPPSNTTLLVGQTKTFYSPRLRSQPTGKVTVNASSQDAGTATVTGSKSFSTGNWNTAQDFKVTGKRVGTTSITYDVDSSDTRYDGYDLNSTSVTVEATSITCGADDTNIQLGGSSILSWDSTNASSVNIDQGIGTIPLDSAGQGKSVTPPQPGATETSRATTYRFTASGAGNPGTCSVTITVWRPPSVGRFSAAPATLRKQQSTRLVWATSHASAASINQGIGTVPLDSSGGGRSVTPPQPSTAATSRKTSYRLTASNPGYTGANAATATVSVTVWNRPSVDSFTASPSTINEGEDSRLKWTTTHATSVSIDRGVGSVSVDDQSGNTKVSPDQGTTYTLTASNPGYSGARAATDSVRVAVNAPSSLQPQTPGLTVSPTTLNITEGTAAESYNVRLKTRPSGDVTVAVDIESGGDSRVRKNTSSLTFTTTDWNRDKAVQVSAEEQSGTATGQARITNTPSSSYGGSAVGVTVNVSDDDTDGCEATVTPTRLTIDEGESNDGFYDVVLATSPAASVTITLDLAGDPSLSADRPSLTFTTANWNTSQRVTIEAGEDDNASEGRATIGHTASSTDEGCSGISISSVSVDIRDNDEPPPLPAITLSSDGSSVSEPDGTATVTASVASGEEPVDDLTVNLTHSGRAANGTDYTVARLTISSGATSGEAELTVVDDSVVEGTEEIRLIAGADGYRDSAPLSMDLTDDDSAGLSIAPTQLTIAEGSSDSYEVVLTSQPTHEVTVAIARNGDADISLDDQELTFSDSDWNQPQRVTVSAAQDADAIDDTATFSHTVGSSDADYNGITVSDVDVTVTDDETAGVSTTPTRLTIAEGSSDSYEVVLTSEPSHNVTVAITHNGDYDIGVGGQELTFTGSDWETAQTVTVSASHDGDAIGDTATFSHTVASSDGDYNGISVSEVDVTVTDDETVGVSITPTQLTIAEGGSDSYDVVLTSEPSHNVTVAITHNGDYDIGVGDQELTFTDSDWETAQTVTVSASHDDDATDDMATLSHSVASTDANYNGTTVSGVDVTVTDDETAGVSITPTELTIAEGGSDSYDVVLTSEPSHDVAITISPSGDGDISIHDQELTFTDFDWDTAQTVTVLALQDHDAIDDTGTFSHAAVSTDADYNGTTVLDVDVSVADDDTASVSITPTELTISEGGSGGYQVVLTSQPAHDVKVMISHNGDAEIDSNTDRLTFSSSDWDTAQTVTVLALQDDDAINDTGTFSHTAASTDADYDGTKVPEVNVTATDDETTNVSITPTLLTISEGGSDHYQMVLTSQPTHDVTVVITHSGDPDVGIDAGSLTFAATNWNEPQAVRVEALPDDDAVNDTATLVHSSTSSDGAYDGLVLSDVRISVGDDDLAGVSITPTTLSVPEGASGTYTVVLKSRPANTVYLAVSSDNRDLTPSPASLTFAPNDWNAPQTVRAQAAQDDDALDEKARFSHAATSADPTYQGTLVEEVVIRVSDNDSARVKVTPTRLEMPEDASTTYTVALTSRPSQPVVVVLSHNGDPDISANVDQVSFEPSEWDNPGTVTVRASPDSDAVDDVATLSHSATSADSTYDGAPVDPVRITVGDLDSAGVAVSPLNLTIDEGGSRTYTVVLTSKPSRDVVVEVERRGDEDVVPRPDSLTFDVSNWDEPRTVTVQALQDPDAVDDIAILGHSTTSSDSAYGGMAVPDVSVSVIDDDAVGVSVSPRELTLSEGDSGTVTVVLTSKPSEEVRLSLRSNNSDISTLPVSLTFSPATWSTTQQVSVPVSKDDDATDEVGTLTFSATSSDPTYHGIPVPTVSVDINDDDNAGVKVVPNPHMSVPEGESATYTVVLLSQPMATVTVSILSSNPKMLTAIIDQVTFTQDNWNIAQAVGFDTFYDENTLDENEVFSHSANSYDPHYKSISVTPLRVTITDLTAEELTRALPVLMSAMSGALAESAQTAIESRFERWRQLQRMKQEQGWWMPTYHQDRSRHSPGLDASGGPETGPIPSGTSFGFPLAGAAFAGSYRRPVLWGHGDFQHFDGNSSQIEFRGGLGATHIGMDLLSNRQLLTGLSFARSWGSMKYSDSREGRLAASFNTFHPYLHWQPHRRLSLWGIGGVGRGSVDIRDPRLAHIFNAEFRMWAGGLRSLLTRPGNNELGLRVDGFMSNIGIDPFERIGEVYGKASRARAMLEVIHQRGGRKRSFSLKSEIGGRLDRGEAVHGTSVESGLRLGFIDSPTGLGLALQGRMLLFHDGGYQDWGAGLQASWDPGNKRRGLRMSALASHGQNGRGGAALWDHSYADSRGQGRGLPSSLVPVSRIDSEAAYGLEVLQGRGMLTPFSRLRWTGHGKQWSVGSEFGLQPTDSDTNPLNLELEGTRAKSSRGADMGVRFRMSIPF